MQRCIICHQGINGCRNLLAESLTKAKARVTNPRHGKLQARVMVGLKPAPWEVSNASYWNMLLRHKWMQNFLAKSLTKAPARVTNPRHGRLQALVMVGFKRKLLEYAIEA